MAHPFNPLSQADALSPVWKSRIKPQLVARLDELRTELEKPSNTDASTASLRGKIAVLKEILALERDPVAEARRHAAALQNDE